MNPNSQKPAARRATTPAVDRALTILELLVAERQPLSLSEIASRAGVPLASCSAIMRTLEAREYASEEITGRTHYWRPTLAVYRLGAELMSRLGLAEVAQRHLERLAEELRNPAHAGVLENSQVVYLAKATGPSFAQFHTFVGRSVPFQSTALGKAIAAFMPAERQESVIAQCEDRNGSHVSSAAAARLRAELAECRERGYALEDGEEYEGIACVAAPVFGAEGRLVGGVSVTGFSKNVLGRRQKDSVAAVCAVAAAISSELGAPVRTPA